MVAEMTEGLFWSRESMEGEYFDTPYIPYYYLY